MKILTIASLTLVSLIVGTSQSQTAERPKVVYVADFTSEKILDPGLLRRVSDDFEEIVTDSNRYKVVERRRNDQVERQLSSESAVLHNSELLKQLQKLGAEAFFSGRVEDDVESGEYIFYLTLEKFDGTRLWSKSGSLSRGLIRDRSSRIKVLSQLIDVDSRAKSDPGQSSAVAPLTGEPSHPKSTETHASITASLPLLENARLSSMSRFYSGFANIGFYRCANEELQIRCLFVAGNSTGNRRLTMANADPEWESSLLDNLNVSHMQLSSSLLDGNGHPLTKIDLGPGEKVWVLQEFEGANAQVNEVRVQFTRQFGNGAMKGPLR